MQIAISKKIYLPLLLGSIIALLILFGSIQSDLNSASIAEQTTIEKFKIILGNLYPGSGFESYDKFILNIPKNKQDGLQITTLKIITSLYETTDQENYLGNIFSNFYIDLAIKGEVYTFEIVKSGEIQSAGDNAWKYQKTESAEQGSLVYSSSWNEVFLDSGNYNIDVRTYGTTTDPKTCKFGRYFCDQLTLSYDLVFKLA